MSLLSLALVVCFAAPTAQEAPPEEPRVLPQGVIEIHVADLHCQSCAKKLARKLYTTPGVKRVKTYVAKDLAIIELQPKKEVDLAKLWQATKQAKQEPVALLVLDQKLVAKDFEKPAKTAAKPTPRR